MEKLAETDNGYITGDGGSEFFLPRGFIMKKLNFLTTPGRQQLGSVLLILLAAGIVLDVFFL